MKVDANIIFLKVCNATSRSEHGCFYTSAFSTSFFVLSAMDDKIKQYVCIMLCVKLSQSTTKNLEMLCEAFGEYSLSQMGFPMEFAFQGWSTVS
jgi:hypothetical protein